MKIIDIKKYISADRKVHVVMDNGGYKDGYLSIVHISDEDAKAATFFRVKGDRGRPATIHPASIVDITWLSLEAEVVLQVRKDDLHRGAKVLDTVQPQNLRGKPHCRTCKAVGVTLTAVKERDGSRGLYCAVHVTAAKAWAHSDKASTPKATLAFDARINALHAEIERISRSNIFQGDLVDVALEALRRA